MKRRARPLDGGSLSEIVPEVNRRPETPRWTALSRPGLRDAGRGGVENFDHQSGCDCANLAVSSFPGGENHAMDYTAV